MYAILFYFTLFITPLHAQTNLNTDTKKPITIDAESVTYQLNNQTITFAGSPTQKIKITQTGRTLTAQNLVASLSAEGDLKRLNATGGVTLQQTIKNTTEKATSQSAVYNMAAGELILQGNATITRGENTLTGETLIYNLNTGTVKVTPKSGGRIRANLKPQ